MAKNFGQYDDENPVMATLAKARAEQEIKNATEILQSASVANQSEILKAAESQTANQKDESQKKADLENQNQKDYESPSENQSQIKKILMNISIRETTKKEWKMFFLEHDLTMTQGIETAVEFLRSEVEKGNIKLSKGGITK